MGAPVDRLTPRQLSVLRAIAMGDSEVTAALRLGLKPQTVKNHLHEAFVRLEVHSSIGAFVALGWLRPDREP